MLLDLLKKSLCISFLMKLVNFICQILLYYLSYSIFIPITGCSSFLQ